MRIYKTFGLGLKEHKEHRIENSIGHSIEHRIGNRIEHLKLNLNRDDFRRG